MPSVRDELEKALGFRRNTLRISNYPVATNWKHTYWWREGNVEFAEAQFVAQIAKEYPVLSLGAAVEKGFEIPQVPKQKSMDRRTWDWPRFVDNVEQVLLRDVAEVATKLGESVHLRIKNKAWRDEKGKPWTTRAFSFVDGKWFERYVGGIDPRVIVDHIRDLNNQKDFWAIVHFARDLGPNEADGLSAQQMAQALIAFDPIRRRLKGAL